MAIGQQNQVVWDGEKLQTAGLLAVGSVGSVVTARGEDAPTSPSGPRPKPLVAVQFGIFRQALINVLLALACADTKQWQSQNKNRQIPIGPQLQSLF